MELLNSKNTKFKMNKNGKRFFCGILLFFIGFVSPAAAQMTDDQIVNYVQSAMQSGKNQMQIARELMAKGVSMNQLQRLQSKYGGGQQSSGSSGNSTGSVSGMLGGSNAYTTRNRDNGYSKTDSRLRKRSGSVKDRRLDAADRDRLLGLSDERSADAKNSDDTKDASRENERMVVPMNANYAMGSYLLAGADSLGSKRKPPSPTVCSCSDITFSPSGS